MRKPRMTKTVYCSTDISYDEWFNQLVICAAKSEDAITERNEWKEEYLANQSPSQAFYAAYPHR